MRVTTIGPGNTGRARAAGLLAGGYAITLVGRDARGGRSVNRYRRWTARNLVP